MPLPRELRKDSGMVILPDTKIGCSRLLVVPRSVSRQRFQVATPRCSERFCQSSSSLSSRPSASSQCRCVRAGRAADTQSPARGRDG